MCIQLLSLRDTGCLHAEIRGCLVVQRDDAGDAHKIERVQRRGKTRGTAGGHRVTWPGHVIAQHLKRSLADKQATGMRDHALPLCGIFRGEAQVFRRKFIGEAYALFDIARDDDAALPCQ